MLGNFRLAIMSSFLNYALYVSNTDLFLLLKTSDYFSVVTTEAPHRAIDLLSISSAASDSSCILMFSASIEIAEARASLSV
jgi:hypothetical protein